MNKIIYALCAAFLLPLCSESAETFSACDQETFGYMDREFHNWEVEFRLAGVYSTSKRFRKIYSEIEPEIQLEFSRRMYEKIYAWANVGWLWDNGRSIGLEKRTELNFYPFTFGFKYEFDLCCNVSAYLGGGAAYGYLRLRNHSEGVKKHFDSTGWGGIIKSGLHYSFCNNLYLDVFVDYLYLKISKRHDLAGNQTYSPVLGGILVGIGIGTKF